MNTISILIFIYLFYLYRILDDTKHDVPVASSIVPGYLSPDAEANIKWVDNKKQIFSFSSTLCSTIFTQDSNLNEFFKQYSSDGNPKQLSMVSTNSKKSYT